MLRLASFILFAILALLSLSALPSTSAAVSQRLWELKLAQEREALLNRSTVASSSAALLGAVRQLDCPITSNWVTAFTNLTGVYGLAPVSGCTLLAVVSQRLTYNSSLLAINASDGSTLWSLPVADGLSIFSISALTVSPSQERVYLHFRNFSRGGDCELSCDSVSAASWAGGKPQLLWNVVLDDSSYVLQPMGVEGAQEREEVLVALGPEWVSIEGRTGRVLSSTSHSGRGYLQGDSRQGRLLTMSGRSATSYQLHSNGSFVAVGQAQWQTQEGPVLASTPFFSIPQISSLLVLQSATQADRLRAVDARTGAEVWRVSGYDILTGAWVTQDGFKAQPAQLSLHPINSSWAIASARAFNSSFALLVQHALLDLTTGRLVAHSPVSPLLSAPTSYSSDFQWYAASGRVATFIDLPDSPAPSLYLAYDQTLQAASYGLIPAGNPLHELETRFAAVGKEAASLVWRTGDQILGQGLPAMSAAEKENRHVRAW